MTLRKRKEISQRQVKQENFYVLCLNTQNYIISEHLISKGILDASIIHPREVFRPAIKNSASKIILIHNHPSGDSKLSIKDKNVTEELIKIGKSFGIKVLDHIVISNISFSNYNNSE